MTQLPAEGGVDGTVHSYGIVVPASPPPVPVAPPLPEPELVDVVVVPEVLVAVVVLPEVLVVVARLPPVPEPELVEVVVVSALPPRPEPELEVELVTSDEPLLLFELVVVTAVVFVPLVLLEQPAHTAITLTALARRNQTLLFIMVSSPELVA